MVNASKTVAAKGAAPSSTPNMRTGQVYLFNSASGAITKAYSPLLLGGTIAQAEYYEIAKAVGEKSIGTKRLREKYGTNIDGVVCASRPVDFYLYSYALTVNTYHMRAVRAKVKDITGRPWHIEGDAPDTTKKELTSFFTNAFGGRTYTEGMGDVWTDYESLGNGYLEVVPNKKGTPSELTHVPAVEIWARLDGLGFVQQKNGEYAHFRAFGVADEKYADLPSADPLTAPNCTGLIHFSRYFPFSPFYGLPSVMPAWGKLALMALECEYNLQFFNNNAIPDYAVIMEGDWSEGSVDKIQEYFRTHLKGQAHKTLVLETPDGCKIRFEKLTSDAAKEGSFKLLRTDCRDEILQAHGVPPQKAGIVESGRLGGNGASEQIIEYKNSIVTPGQTKVSARMDRVIALGFGVPNAQFKFEEYDVDDEKLNSDIDGAYLDRQVVTPNEVRRKRYPTFPSLPGGDVPLERGTGGPAGDPAALLETVQRAVKRSLKK